MQTTIKLICATISQRSKFSGSGSVILELFGRGIRGFDWYEVTAGRGLECARSQREGVKSRGGYIG